MRKRSTFAKAKVDQLKFFILLRTSGETTLSGGQRTLKGTVDGATSGTDSWLKRAFDLRAKDLKRSKTVLAPNTGVASSSITSDPDCLTIQVTRNLEPLLFQITVEWQKRVKAAVDSLSTNADCILVTIDAQQKRSDALCRILFSRLNEHIKSRVKDIAKHSHWVWDFVRNNLSRMASVMVLMNHVQDDLEAMGRHRNRCFLKHCESFIPISEAVMLDTTTEIRYHEGCYPYFDYHAREFIRSGKVVFRSFDTRHIEHRKMAGLTLAGDRKSNFYMSYPTKREAQGNKLPYRLGYFDDLRLFCGLGFNRLTAGHRALFAKEADSAVLLWDDLTLRRLGNANIGGGTDLTKK